jgi:inner membrane protein
VDSLTHALLVASLLTAIGAPALIPFGILGAVILDADVLFYLISSKRPHLYIFIHGGAAHSIAGAAGMAIATYGTVFLLLMTWEHFFQVTLPVTFNVLALVAVIAGAMIHVALDFLASPGIPLFWPLEDTKYTIGIFAGPSVVMILISWAFIILFIVGVLPLSGLIAYGFIFLAYLAISASVRVLAAQKIKGNTFPTINPLRWLVIEKDQNSWSLKFVDLRTGHDSGNRTWTANQGVPEGELIRVSDIPEVRRVRYHSCFTIALRDGNGDIVIEDPSRMEGIIRYPPYYMSIILRQTNVGCWEPVAEKSRQICH